MQREVSLTITDDYRRRFPDLSFGIGTIQSCTYFEKNESFKLYKRELLRKMKRRANLAQIQEWINHYDQFFKEWGYPCPLPGHFKRTIEMGFSDCEPLYRYPYHRRDVSWNFNGHSGSGSFQANSQAI